MALVRHFTSTGFVIQDGATLLHWHAKVKAWLPPGGHIMNNEDPVQAVLREVLRIFVHALDSAFLMTRQQCFRFASRE